METVMHILLIRFAIIAAVVAVIAVVLFAIAVRLKKRGRWEETRDKIAPVVSKATAAYLDSRRRRRW